MARLCTVWLPLACALLGVLTVLASEDEAAAAQEAVASTVDASNSTNGTNATLWEQCTSLDELVVMLKKGADEMEPG